ncbi:hypothetical protein Mal4_19890 [Maioricimonas rarisocia]|uniref:Uncharacterized protein n=1 Tax=Maioricimonas rarisocia TaxID=2528026 RepID=A0A517Z5D8_9PLAN|nr:hypothetical protein [Maioricimonas rarisocia]QDU37673.1 hypothetical protein Mal4_19890 [Maioricimonas rarisocia]
MSRTLSWTFTVGLLLLSVSPASLRAQPAESSSDEQAKATTVSTRTVVCPDHAYMEWGSYTSYYSFQHEIVDDECDEGTPVNYDGPNGLETPQGCPDCIDVAILPAAAPGERQDRSVVSANGHGHHPISLPRPLGRFRTDRDFYNGRCRSGYRVHGNHTERALYKFTVIDNSDAEVPVYVVARRIRLIWRGPGTRPEKWPRSHIQHVGQEVDPDAPENGEPGDSSRFTDVSEVRGEVEKITENIVHLKIPQEDGSWWIYQIVTATPIKSIE